MLKAKIEKGKLTELPPTPPTVPQSSNAGSGTPTIPSRPTAAKVTRFLTVKLTLLIIKRVHDHNQKKAHMNMHLMRD